jgi:hypothetical protein
MIAMVSPAMRYIMLGIVLYVALRMLVALFFKKTTDPVRAKLVNTVTNEAVSLYERETSIGRNKKCDIVLPFDTISRLHAVIAYRNKGFVIFDTFSKSGVSVNGEKNTMPTDRTIDGVSMLPLLTGDKVIHTEEHPILHMKREKLKAIQYTVPTETVKTNENYSKYDYAVLNENENVTFKYFRNIQNDNSAFFDKYRKNWLHILTDDVGENYNRTTVYPEVSEKMNAKMDEVMASFKENRRGINFDYYK